MNRKPFARALLIATVTLTGAAFADEPGGKPESAGTFEDVPGAKALEGRIMAPCCWQQTIDIHGSEIGNELRREIRTRLKAGETPEAIEKDFVARYGPKILAVPPDNPLVNVASVASLGFVAAGVSAAFMLVRWKRRSGVGAADDEPKKKKKAAEKRDELDEQIDRELDNL